MAIFDSRFDDLKGRVTDVALRNSLSNGGGYSSALTVAHLEVMHGTSAGSDMNAPLQTILSGGHHAEVRAFLIAYYGTEQDPQLQIPLATVTTFVDLPFGLLFMVAMLLGGRWLFTLMGGAGDMLMVPLPGSFIAQA